MTVGEICRTTAIQISRRTHTPWKVIKGQDPIIAHSAQRSGEHFDKYEENVARCDQREHIGTDPDDGRILCEKPEERDAEQHQKYN